MAFNAFNGMTYGWLFRSWVNWTDTVPYLALCLAYCKFVTKNHSNIFIYILYIYVCVYVCVGLLAPRNSYTKIGDIMNNDSWFFHDSYHLQPLGPVL